MQNNHGTTLIELLLALGLMSLVLAGLMSVFWFSSGSFNREITKSDLHYAARQGRERIMKDFRISKSFSVRDTNGKDMEMGQTGTRLHLMLEDEIVDYYVKNHQLYRNSSSSSPEPFAENIQDIGFVNAAPGLLNITLKTSFDNNEFVLRTTSVNRVDYPDK